MATRRLPLLTVVGATALALVAAAGVFLVLDDGDSSGGSSAADSPMELTPAPDLPSSVDAVVLGGLDSGPDRRLGDLLGQRPVVVNFFASWCEPCLREMPDFEAVHQQLGDRVTFVGMATRDASEDALTMVDRTGVSYATYADPAGSAITYFGGLVMPTTVFIDGSGQVVDVASEPLTADQLRGKVEDLFGITP